MSDSYTNKEVQEKKTEWSRQSASSIERADNCVRFAELYEQWTKEQIADRNGKEYLTVSQITKHLRKVQAMGTMLELSLNLSHVGDSNVDQPTILSYKKILSHIMINEHHKQSFAESLENVYSRGQSTLFVNVKREDERTLNQKISIECISDINKPFFDKHSPSRTMHDGQYCGMTTKISKDIIKKIYPKLTEKGLEKQNTITDFWFKKQVPKKYFMTESRQWKEFSLLTDKEKKNKGRGKKSYGTQIRHIRYLNEFEEPLYNDDWFSDIYLPLVFNYGLSVKNNNIIESFPFVYPLLSPQTLHNYCASQIANSIKQATDTKWISGKDNIQSPDAEESAKNINKRAGMMQFDGDIAKIQRHDPIVVPQILPELLVQSKKEIDDIIGAVNEESAGDLKATSGKALSKLFSRQDLLENPVVKAHTNSINIVGTITQSMIPNVYTENRKLMVSSEDKKIESIEINKDVKTGGLINNIASISDEYKFSISAGVSTDIQKQNTLASLQSIYAINPQAFNLTADLYAKQLDSQDSDQISLRLSTMVDPKIIALSKGEITLEQLNKPKSPQPPSPEEQLVQAKIQAEESKAQAAEYKAKADTAIANIELQLEEAKLQLQGKELMSKNYNAEKDRIVQMTKADIQRADALIGKN